MKGELVLGGVDRSLYEGELVNVASHRDLGYTWLAFGDVTMNNTIKCKYQPLIIDSGTSNMIG